LCEAVEGLLDARVKAELREAPGCRGGWNSEGDWERMKAWEAENINGD